MFLSPDKVSDGWRDGKHPKHYELFKEPYYSSPLATSIEDKTDPFSHMLPQPTIVRVFGEDPPFFMDLVRRYKLAVEFIFNSKSRLTCSIITMFHN
uniref:Uncharacterized protein n=1 Tax=Salix viminalis TaxID=40686 RepID=A0A6N2K1P7_SALVM